MPTLSGPLNPFPSPITSSNPNLCNVLNPFGPNAILAPISFNSVALSYNTTFMRGCFWSAIAAVRPAIPAPIIAMVRVCWLVGDVMLLKLLVGNGEIKV